MHDLCDECRRHRGEAVTGQGAGGWSEGAEDEEEGDAGTNFGGKKKQIR